MEKQRGTVNYLTVFIGVILAVSFIIAIAGLTQEKTNLTTVTNELVNIAPARLASGVINTTYPFTVTNAPTGWKQQDCPLTSVVYGNSTTDYTLTTDYTFTASTGVLLLKNTAVVNNSDTNSTYIDYKYCGNGYVDSSWGRTVLNTNVGLYAVAILIIVVGLVYYYLKNQDLE
jgi:hypothetical protein